jgi:S1-C subfamily serine protease
MFLAEEFMSIRRVLLVWLNRGAHFGLFLLLISSSVCTAAYAGQGSARPEKPSCSESVPDIYDRVSPAVVLITATSLNPYQPSDRVSRVAGSGVILDGTGLIVTNSHVVFGRQAVTVTLDDGTTVPGQVVGIDPVFDLAVLRIAKASAGTLPAASVGESSRLRVGEEVLAIGNPLGLEQTLTRGIVSAINRILPDTSFSLMEPLIQTDTAINPGNSGGPLLNRCGDVIGITTAILPDAQGIGFAIPIDLVKAVLPSLLTHGRIIRPWLGVQGKLIAPALLEFLRAPLTEGLLIEVVEPGSPAERAGLQGGQLDLIIGGKALLLGGDIITHLNGRQINTPEALAEAMRALKVGDSVRLTIFNDGRTREVDVVLPERPLLPQDIQAQRSGAPLGTSRLVDRTRYRL